MLPNHAYSVRICGVVQGVGFRPFVYRLALRHHLYGWVRNDAGGVTVHLEGRSIEDFLRDLRAELPPAARLDDVRVIPAAVQALSDFKIMSSEGSGAKVTPISPDLAPCAECLREMRDPHNRRYRYPYINCTNCGPRYSIVLGLPYDRQQTTMRAWPLCAECLREYGDPHNRRYHAQPVACAECGPTYRLSGASGWEAIKQASELLRRGQILAVKGVGGYHLMCDAQQAESVKTLRERKYRKEKPFALLARDVAAARTIVHLTPQDEAALLSAARPIVLAPANVALPQVAPLPGQLGVMLPASPLHELLFDAGAPPILVATSANRNSEPMVIDEAGALSSLAPLYDALLVGERPIARRVDDSVTFAGSGQVVRRARGLAPAMTAKLPTQAPVLAVGADLKNTVTLVVEGQAFTSTHLGDLEHFSCRQAHQAAIHDVLDMYGLRAQECVVAHDLHPQYVSTQLALALPALRWQAAQHHAAHMAGVLAEHGLFEARALGLILDGTGYGPDGSIWGGELLIGSLAQLSRVGQLWPATLPGGDAAAKWPAQAAAGFLSAAGLPLPGEFPQQARVAAQLAARALTTTSCGRLFDAAAALLGFHGAQAYEGQAALWLEALARQAAAATPLPFTWNGAVLDWRPALAALLRPQTSVQQRALAFHVGLAGTLARAAKDLCQRHALGLVVLSGGVWQNQLLLRLFTEQVRGLEVLTNQHVPVNDGGLSLGQAALIAATAAR